MSVRGKFRVVSITDNGPNAAKGVRLQTQYDQSIPEDQRFQKATPFGDLNMNIDNPAALAQLEVGKSFYLDLVPVE